jgi:hypothetical protein
MLTPAHPVSAIIWRAASGVVMSPFPMTGMERTDSTTERMPRRLTAPENPWARVRPWTKTAATPASSRAPARSGAVMFSESQPRRIFAVTGIEIAPTIPRTRSAVLPSSVIIAEPPPIFVTFLTGQPMLMSTACAPMSSHITAASRISPGTLPKSWMESGRSPAQDSTSLSAVGLRSMSERAFTRSVVAQPRPPSSRRVIRIGRFV